MGDEIRMNKYAFKVYAHANKQIQKRIDKLEEMAGDLHAKLLEKYPYDLYGMKADILYDQKVEAIRAEIKELRPYLNVLHSLREAAGDFKQQEAEELEYLRQKYG